MLVSIERTKGEKECVQMRKSLRMLGVLFAAVMLLSAFAGCSTTEGESSAAGSDVPDGSGTTAETKVFNVKDYGAVGDGVTDDYNAVKKALDEAIAYDGTKILQFEKDATYLMATRPKNKNALDIQNAKNLTVQGENTTIVIDMDKRVNTYFNINECKNIKVKGFNLKTLKSVYAIADVNSIDRANRTIEFTTDRSLEIDSTYYASVGDCFGLPYIGEDVNRMHLFFDEMEVVDASANRYRIQFRNEDNVDGKLEYMERTGSQFLVPRPYWGQEEGSAFIVTNTENADLEDINLWSASTFNFHMRYNSGVVNLKNVNLTPEPGTDMAMVGWRDGFHLKDNRAQFIWDGCKMEKVFDDVFNISCTMMRVTEVISDTEFKMECPEFDGTYWLPMQAGDELSVYDEKIGTYIGTTTIKEVVNQKGADNHIIVNDPLPGNAVGVSVALDSAAAPNSIIRNCDVSGTYRFRAPLLVENCELKTMYAWLDNLPNIEGPFPHDIHFKNCKITKVHPADRKDSFCSSDYLMVIGNYTTSGAMAQFISTGIVFEDCEINKDEISFYRSCEVQFIRNGEVYDQYPSRG